MNKLLIRLIPLLVFILMTGMSPKVTEVPDRVEVLFNNSMTIEYLVDIKKEMLDNNIILNYKSLDFDDEGYLKSIEISVDCADGYSGSAKTKNVNKKLFGFYRDYSGEIPFDIGEIYE